jgi:hypothetical protein
MNQVKNELWLSGVALVIGGLLGCGDDGGSSSDGNGGSTGTAAAGGGAGSNASAGASGSAGTLGGSGGAASGNAGGTGGASPLWSRDSSASCGTLGTPCAGCGSDSICYLSAPNACVPRPGGGLRCSVGGCAADKPYCIDENCMTLAQAQCFCTAEPGSSASGCDQSPTQHLTAGLPN